MARSEARLHFDVMEGLRGLSKDAKLLYMGALLVEPTVNQAGIGALRERRWAKETELSPEETQRALGELDAGRFAFVDYDTEEIFVRTIIRRDKVAERPNVLWAACRVAEQVKSPRLRHELAKELRKLPPKPPDKPTKAGGVFVHPDPHAVADRIDPGPLAGHPQPNCSATVGEPFDNLSANRSRTTNGGGGGGGEGSTPVATSDQRSKDFPAQQTIMGEPPADEDATPPPRLRGSRIPDDFAVDHAMVAWAREHAPNIDGRRETEKFIDYWRSKTGKDATKLDWIATWRNWMRSAEERSPKRRLAQADSSPWGGTSGRKCERLQASKDPDDAAGPPLLRALPGGA